MGHDLVAFGEALLRLQPDGGERIETVERLRAFPGGAELNCCCALAGLGLRVAWFSALPEGPLGRRILRHLRAAGVDTSLVRTRPGRLGAYWVDYGREPRQIEVIYDRAGSTVCGVRREEVPWDALREARAFFLSGITPALSPSAREVALEMAEAARAAGGAVVLDLNYRARLWEPREAAPVLERFARVAHVLIATEDDLRTLYGWGAEADSLAREALSRFHPRLVVLTRGADGALAVEESGVVRRASVFPGPTVDRIGAGDAFAAGFLFATLSGRAPRALDYGLALAALKRSLPGDTLTTTVEELESVLTRERREIRR